MSLHFLLSAEARSLSLVQILALSDDDAFTLFRRQRWGDGENVVCPHCGMAHRHYFRPARKIWRCAGCRADCSVTSGIRNDFRLPQAAPALVPRSGHPFRERR